MRILPLLLLTWGVSTLGGWAQVAVEIVLDQDQYIRDESLPVKVRITNRSGQTLQLGRDNEWLSFAVESLEQGNAGAVARLAETPVSGEFKLESAQVATRQVDLTPYFDISQTGRYQVSALLKVKSWNEEFSSKPRPFEIVRGTKIWEQEFGVPAKTGEAPEPRKYTLQQANYRKQLMLYLRVSDASDQRVLRVFPLGALVSFSQTEAQLDKNSYLHALFQTGPRGFLFCVVNPEGELVLRQSYDYGATRPTLRAGDEGRIFVAGGNRRLSFTDVPATLSKPVLPDFPDPALTNARPTNSANPANPANPAKPPEPRSSPDGKGRKD